MYEYKAYSINRARRHRKLQNGYAERVSNPAAAFAPRKERFLACPVISFPLRYILLLTSRGSIFVSWF